MSGMLGLDGRLFAGDVLPRGRDLFCRMWVYFLVDLHLCSHLEFGYCQMNVHRPIFLLCLRPFDVRPSWCLFQPVLSEPGL
jgi:hypothetical protein